MKNLSARLFTVAALLAAPLLTPSNVQAQGWQWATAALAHSRSHGGQATAVALDAAGNTLVAGVFRDTLVCGATQLISQGEADVFIGKLSPGGQWLWALRAGGPAADTVTAIVATPAGGAVIAGTALTGTAIGPAQVTGGASGLSTLYIARLSPAGQWEWVASPTPPITAAIPSALRSGSLATDALGRVWFSGSALGMGAGAYGFGSQRLEPRGQFGSSFVGCLSAAGQWEWVGEPADALGNTGITQLAVDAGSNALYVAGQYGETNPMCGMEFGTPHAFVGRLNAQMGGAWQWFQADTAVYYHANAYVPGGAPYVVTGNTSTIGGLTTDGVGRLFVAGSYDGQASLAGAPLGVAPFPSAYQDTRVFIVALDAATGASQWRHRAEASTLAGHQLAGLTTTPTGDVTITGWGTPHMLCGNGGVPANHGVMQFGDSISLNLGSLTGNFGSTYVARFAGATGTCQWVAGADFHALVVASNVTGTLVAAGDYNQEATVGPTTLPYPMGWYQPVVASFTEAAPLLRSISATTAAPGAVITLRGRQFTGATQVLLSGVPVQFTVVNATTIRLTVPASVSSGAVTVVTPTGTATGLYFWGLVLGAADEAQATSLQVWPNPAPGATAVRLALPAGARTSGVVTDALGRMVQQFTPSATENQVLLAPLLPGIYSVRYGAATARLVVE